MTLTDAGPLIALVERTDQHHLRVAAALASLPPGGMITTWPCFSEVIYHLRKTGGWQRVEGLFLLYTTGLLRVHHADDRELDRAIAIMTQYRDLPCDLADASLVAASETLNTTRIFTLDSHFYAYRTAHGSAFTVVP